MYDSFVMAWMFSINICNAVFPFTRFSGPPNLDINNLPFPRDFLGYAHYLNAGQCEECLLVHFQMIDRFVQYLYTLRI